MWQWILKRIGSLIALLGGKKAIKNLIAGLLVKVVLKADEFDPVELADDVHDEVQEQMYKLLGEKAAEKLEDGWLVKFFGHLVDKWKKD